MYEDIAVRIRSGIGWNTATQIAIQAYGFVIAVIVARILDPNDSGIMAIGFMVISYSNMLTSFGFYNALVQLDDVTPDHVNSTFTVDFILCFFSLFLILCSTIPSLNYSYP